MSKNNETYIGKVRSVTGTVLAVELNENIRSTLPVIEGVLYRIGQIGSFIKIPLGYIDLYGIITQAGSDAIPENIADQKEIKSSRWITVTLIGERVSDKFEKGVLQFPIADDEVHLVTKDDLELIYGRKDDRSSLVVGQVSASENLAAKIDVDRFINRHCAILGSTGSGKSNTVSVILEAIANRKDVSGESIKSTRILLIDPHGEYGEILGEHSKIFKVGADVSKNEEELIVPFWALSFQELIKSFPGNLSEKQEEYIREKVLQKKIESAKKLSPKPKEDAITADSPIPFSIKQLWFDLIDVETKTFNDKDFKEECLLETGDPASLRANKYGLASTNNTAPYSNNRVAQGISGFLNLMKNRILDQRFKFLFDIGDLNPDLEGKVNQDLNFIIEKWVGTEKAITILDLSSIPSEIMSSISGSLLSTIYEFLYWGQGEDVGGRKTPILFVLEEAHSYLNSNEDSIASRTVQKIAKEGRKYGSGLLLITQRPSELDETVLSQCGSVIALRMTNSNDRGHIKSAMDNSLGELVDLLPSLRTGEGLIMGECVKLPMRTKFSKAKESKSTDPKVSELWKNKLPNSGNYKKVLTYWRNNKIS